MYNLHAAAIDVLIEEATSVRRAPSLAVKVIS
jgi:hypothetical protein